MPIGKAWTGVVFLGQRITPGADIAHAQRQIGACSIHNFHLNRLAWHCSAPNGCATTILGDGDFNGFPVLAGCQRGRCCRHPVAKILRHGFAAAHCITQRVCRHGAQEIVGVGAANLAVIRRLPCHVRPQHQSPVGFHIGLLQVAVGKQIKALRFQAQQVTANAVQCGNQAGITGQIGAAALEQGRQHGFVRCQSICGFALLAGCLAADAVAVLASPPVAAVAAQLHTHGLQHLTASAGFAPFVVQIDHAFACLQIAADQVAQRGRGGSVLPEYKDINVLPAGVAGIGNGAADDCRFTAQASDQIADCCTAVVLRGDAQTGG